MRWYTLFVNVFLICWALLLWMLSTLLILYFWMYKKNPLLPKKFSHFSDTCEVRFLKVQLFYTSIRYLSSLILEYRINFNVNVRMICWALLLWMLSTLLILYFWLYKKNSQKSAATESFFSTSLICV